MYEQLASTRWRVSKLCCVNEDVRMVNMSTWLLDASTAIGERITCLFLDVISGCFFSAGWMRCPSYGNAYGLLLKKSAAESKRTTIQQELPISCDSRKCCMP